MASAAVTAGWQCPTFDTENPASMLTYSLPSASQTRAPLPRTIAGGQSNSAKPTWPVNSLRTCSRRISLLAGPYGDRSTRSSSSSGLVCIRSRCWTSRWLKAR